MLRGSMIFQGTHGGQETWLSSGQSWSVPLPLSLLSYSAIPSLSGRPGVQSQSLGKDAQCSPVLAFKRHSLPLNEVPLFLEDA